MVVCVGNICRSPSADRILSAHLPDKVISSAGFGALVGRGIEPSAAVLLQQYGYDADDHSARQVTGDMLNDADLVLVMEKEHQLTLMGRYPSFSGKVMLLGEWSNKEIHDPYHKSDEAFKSIFDQIEEACMSWCLKFSCDS